MNKVAVYYEEAALLELDRRQGDDRVLEFTFARLNSLKTHHERALPALTSHNEAVRLF